MKLRIFLFAALIFVFTAMYSTLTTLESLSVGIFVFFFLEFLNDLGKRIVILYLPGLIAVMTWLIMPVIFYHVYPKSDWQAKLWSKYMPIPSERYFSFVIPGTLMLITGFRIPLGKLKVMANPKVYLDNAQKALKDKPRVGLTLIGVGLVCSVLDFLSPGSLKQVFYLLDHLVYVGVFYVLYSPNKFKRVVLLSVVALTVAQALIKGMFGEFLFISSLSTILIMLGKRIRFSTKLFISILAIFLILLLQSVKAQYRQRSWKEGSGADPLYMAELLSDRVSNLSDIIDKDKLFFVAVRLNQGWLVAVTMDRVPRAFSFGNGETIWQSIAASLVPRIVWPDKPEAGGKANLKRFWGFEIKGFSMNIGPIGEAYANFDVTGGIIYMFFYGLFFNFMLSQILKWAEKRPTLILWLPFLFMYTVTVEADLLITMNSIIKATFFTWLMFRLYPVFFRQEL